MLGSLRQKLSIPILLFVLYSQFQAFKNGNDFDFNIKHMYINKHSAIIGILSSSVTKNRLQILENLLIDNTYIQNDILTPVFITKDASDNFSFNSVHFPNCNDDYRGPKGLSCKTDSLFSYFLKEYPQSNWLLRLVDDTFLNPDALMRFIEATESLYNPKRHIIFKSMKNNWYGTIYLHGGVGWLMSRAFVEYLVSNSVSISEISKVSLYGQDDTAQTQIVNYIYKDIEKWHDPHFGIHRFPLLPQHISDNCVETNENVLIENMILVHTYNFETNLSLILPMIKKGIPNICHYHVHSNMTSRFCYCESDNLKYPFLSDRLRKLTPLLTKENAPNISTSIVINGHN